MYIQVFKIRVPFATAMNYILRPERLKISYALDVINDFGRRYMVRGSLLTEPDQGFFGDGTNFFGGPFLDQIRRRKNIKM